MATASGMVASFAGLGGAGGGSPAACSRAAPGYLRIAADKHYLSDVLTGALVGSAFGVAMPYFLHRRGAAIPVSVTASARDGGRAAPTGTW